MVMREEDRHGATEFLKQLYAAGQIDAGTLDDGVAGLLAASTETELAELVRSFPAPVTLTSPGQRLASRSALGVIASGGAH
jgi:uncharacterized protein DUF1707